MAEGSQLSRNEMPSVFLADPLPLVRAGIAGLIRQNGEMRILAEASSADDAVASLKASNRRGRVIVLVSLLLTGEHDAEWLIRTLRETFPTYVILALGPGTDTAAVSRALFVGADGFIDTRAESVAFLQGLREALDGQLVLTGLPPELFGLVAQGVRPSAEDVPVLTPREREVLAAAAEGLTAREIGVRLMVRERTVTTHLANVYGKLGVNGRIAAITTAVRSGLVDVSWPA